MTEPQFRALVVDQGEHGREVAIRTLSLADLPAGDVLVQVAYSTINYKDGLGVTGKGKIFRATPMVPGIDFAGTVVESASPDYQPGDQVVLTGWGVGERHWGGFSQYARVRSEWLVPLSEPLSLRQAMSVGTAGFTAMLSVIALEQQGVQPGGKPVLVTGAAGGVGSIAVALLAAAGFSVVASTGRTHEAEYLRSIGASEVIDRMSVSSPGKPLESERWAGVIDTVGGATLAGVLRSVAYYGAVAACGNAGGADFTASVYPFILRGVRLVGVESVMVPRPERILAWDRIARDLSGDLLDRMTDVISLEMVPSYAETITNAQVRGRLVVDVNAHS